MLSIIIPVYNSEAYIGRTLESLENQSFPSFEVILVDDGSTDHSLSLCQQYATKDARFKVFHQANKGVSAARNLGISKASNEVVTFIDSDDYVSNRYCETIVREMCDVDLLVFQSEKHHPDGSREMQISLSGIYKGREAVENGLDYLHKFRVDQFGWPWNKAYKLSILRGKGVLFPEEVCWYEDEVFMLRYGRYVSSIKVIDDVLYHYQFRHDGLTTMYSDPEHMDKVADLLEAELPCYWDERFLAGFYYQLFHFYFSAAKQEKNFSLKTRRLAKAKRYYHSHSAYLPEIGGAGKLLFNTPTFIGAVLMHRLGDIL